MYLHCVCKISFYIDLAIFLKIIDSTTFEAGMSYYAKYKVMDNTTLSCVTKHVILKGRTIHHILWCAYYLLMLFGLKKKS